MIGYADRFLVYCLLAIMMCILPEAKSQSFVFKGVSQVSRFTNANGIHQDGNLALCRDNSGVLWAVLGHSSLGGIKVWRGPSVENMSLAYDAILKFKLGKAGEAFNKKRYPDGPKSRGQLWPYGLFIDSTGKFYCFVHNETGWYADSTGYTINAQFEGEPDFRHIGMMTSIDSGRTWDFVDWILTAAENSYTTKYQPEAGLLDPQIGPNYSLGAGDHCLFANPNDNFLYLYYTKLFVDSSGKNISDSIYVARADKSNLLGWTKWYNGDWREDGNLGKETAVIKFSAYGPSVAWSSYLNKYLLVSLSRYVWNPSSAEGVCAAQIAVCDDWKSQKWNNPKLLPSVPKDSTLRISAYWTICNNEKRGNIKTVGKTFTLFHNLWANDVKRINVVTVKP